MSTCRSFRATLNHLSINLLTSRFVSRFMRPLRNQIVPVFMLHRVADANRGVRGHAVEDIERALDFIVSHGYTAVSIEDLVASINGQITLPKRAVAFTFDDGYYDQGSFALPLFERRKIPVTAFLATDMIDGDCWPWECKLEFIIDNTQMTRIEVTMPGGMVLKETINQPDGTRKALRAIRSQLKLHNYAVISTTLDDLAAQLNVEVPQKAPPQYQAMTWEEARKLESDYVQFAPHSKSHIILSRLSDTEVRGEIFGSWEKLKDELKNPVPIFCYPNGRQGEDFTERERALAKEAGLIGAFSADSGYVHIAHNSQQDLYSLNRFAFPNNMAHFKQYCSWLERAKGYLPGREAKTRGKPFGFGIMK